MDDLIGLLNRYNREQIAVRYDDLICQDPGLGHGTRVHFYS